MSGEDDAISNMDFLRFLPGAGSLDAMRELMDAVGPEMPDDLQSTKVPSKLPGNPGLLTYNYDEGHAGRFSVPGEKSGASLAFDFVLKQQDPFDYIVKNLHFRNKDSVDVRAEEEEEEVVIFVPGLNTPHQPAEGETTTWERVEYYVRVLSTVPMAQMHTGTSFDQGDVRIDASRAGIFRSLVIGLGSNLPGAVKPKEEGDEVVWAARQIDNIQLTLSQYNVIDTPVKEHIRELLDTTKDKDGKPFVLMVYSRGSIECEAALRKYIDNCTKGFIGGESDEDIEKRLRERVTVVTIGSASHDFPDGPAYIHIAAWTDPLASASGMTAKNNAKSGGKDAVFLNCGSPYHVDSFDNHNFGAVTAQLLAIVMAASKATGLRELWDKAQAGDMVVPEDTDDLVKAMIQLTRGFEWLWNVEAAWKDIPMGALPSAEVAEATLREKIGNEFVDRVKANFTTG